MRGRLRTLLDVLVEVNATPLKDARRRYASKLLSRGYPACLFCHRLIIDYSDLPATQRPFIRDPSSKSHAIRINNYMTKSNGKT